MSNTHTIKASNRTEDEKMAQLRKAGIIPAILYGKKMKKAMPIKISVADFNHTLKASGMHQLINIEIDDDKFRALIKDYSKNIRTSEYTHADFYMPDMQEKIIIKVPILFDGEASVVKKFGGIVMKHAEKIKIKALPEEIPQKIKASLAKLAKISDIIKSKDAELPANVELAESPLTVLANVAAPKKSVAKAAPAEAAKGAKKAAPAKK